jgi:hypothetical protein
MVLAISWQRARSCAVIVPVVAQAETASIALVAINNLFMVPSLGKSMTLSRSV